MSRPGRKPRIPIANRPIWAQRLITAREAARLSQAELADQSPVSQSAIADYEMGNVQPSEMMLATLAGVLNVSYQWLAGLAEEVSASSLDSLNTTAKLRPSWSDTGENDAFFISMSSTIADLYIESGRTIDLPMFALICRVAWSSVMMLPDTQPIEDRVRLVVQQQAQTVRILGADPNFWTAASRLSSRSLTYQSNVHPGNTSQQKKEPPTTK